MKSQLGKKLIAGAILVVMTLVPFAALASPEASLENIILTNTRDDLVVYFDVENAFTDGIKKAVLNGVPTSFSFVVSVYKTRDAWFDKKIRNLEIVSTLKYNSLKQEFTVYRPWKTDKPSVTSSFDQAMAMMTEIDNLGVTPLSTLAKGDKYQIRVKAELSRVTLPLYLHYILFFVSMWDFETDWHTMDFIY
jgi:hypothetical protein